MPTRNGSVPAGNCVFVWRRRRGTGSRRTRCAPSVTASRPTSPPPSYWPPAVAIAVVCAAVAVTLAARRGWRGGSPTVRVPVTARHLAAGQVVLFAVLETVERLAVGAHPLSFLSSTPFAVGVVLQVAVALVA